MPSTPTATATKPATRLTITYNAPSAASPSCASSTVSTIHVENVVNPPQNPIAANACARCAFAVSAAIAVRMIPSTTEPSRLTASVVHGNEPAETGHASIS